MAHYAILNSENVVENIITGIDEDELDTLPEGFDDWEEFYSSRFDNKTVKRTSYNTFGGIHADGKTPFRGNYGTVGFIFYEEQDMFLPPKPFDSWVEDFDNFCWKAPIDKPNNTDNFGWVEEDYQEDNTTGWLLITEPEE
jgi:hypothetical protein